ncbi:MAG: RNA pseudouridine synthase [Myxococcales bacterium]|nr:RNA pseudouridine synthase [Myxococcales bacterium]
MSQGLPAPLRVLHVDNHLLAVDKPAGVPTQADASGDLDLLTQARTWVEQTFAKPGRAYLGLVHRLDRPARGVVVFARTSKAAARLHVQFSGRLARKTYRIVVQGDPGADTGTLEHRLESDEHGSRIVAGERGKLARLDWRVLGRQRGRSHVEVDLHSGRKHQIRVQFSAIGCPVVGDLRYGAAAPLADRSIALVAWRLEVEHPTTRERLVFEAGLPNGWPWGPEIQLK